MRSRLFLLCFLAVSAQAFATSASDNVRPLIQVPPESLEPHTLVVPLPGEQQPASVIRQNSTEAVPNNQRALPAPKIPTASQPDDNATGDGTTSNDAPDAAPTTVKTRRIAPVVY